MPQLHPFATAPAFSPGRGFRAGSVPLFALERKSASPASPAARSQAHAVAPPPAGPAGAPQAMPCAYVLLRCRAVRQLTVEMVMLVSERIQMRRDRRRTACHVRQIAMYVCHVVLQISLTEIGQAFGRDRTTVGHACHVVEDRRDDPAYDDFVSAIERIVIAVFGAAGGLDHA